MYAEGDTVWLQDECAKFIRDQIKAIISLLKEEHCKKSLDIGLLMHLYNPEITRFYRTKKLTSVVPNDEGS